MKKIIVVLLAALLAVITCGESFASAPTRAPNTSQGEQQVLQAKRQELRALLRTNDYGAAWQSSLLRIGIRPVAVHWSGGSPSTSRKAVAAENSALVEQLRASAVPAAVQGTGIERRLAVARNTFLSHSSYPQAVALAADIAGAQPLRVVAARPQEAGGSGTELLCCDHLLSGIFHAGGDILFGATVISAIAAGAVTVGVGCAITLAVGCVVVAATFGALFIVGTAGVTGYVAYQDVYDGATYGGTPSICNVAPGCYP